FVDCFWRPRAPLRATKRPLHLVQNFLERFLRCDFLALLQFLGHLDSSFRFDGAPLGHRVVISKIAANVHAWGIKQRRAAIEIPGSPPVSSRRCKASSACKFSARQRSLLPIHAQRLLGRDLLALLQFLCHQVYLPLLTEPLWGPRVYMHIP